MKKYAILILFLIFSFQVFCQKENTLRLSPPLSDAIIYMNGAQLRYHIKVNLQTGINNLVFEKLSPKLIPSSIRITTDENVSVLAIKNRNSENTLSDEQLKLIKIKDSVKSIQKRVISIEDEKAAIIAQKLMLEKNQAIGGENTGVNFLDLQKAVDYYQQKMVEINKKISSLTEESEAATVLLTNLAEKQRKQEEKAIISYSEIILQLMVTNTQESDIQFTYVVTDAGWMPYYDLRCDDLNQPITLLYRAKAYNNCGVDFNNLSLILSTSDPLKSINAPELRTWYLSTYGNIAANYTLSNQNKSINEDGFLLQSQDELTGKQKTQKVSMQQIQVPELSMDFVLKKKYSLPSEPNPYILEIGDYNIKASYDYVCVPAMEKSAFLNACFTDWEDLNLLEGNANIFLNGTYIGQSYLNPNEIIDTLKISLGRDSKIQIDRVKQKEYNSKQFIGSKQKISFVYDISIKNNRNIPINITVLDHLPVSQNQEMEVLVDNISGAVQNLASGELQWKMNIEPQKTEILKLSYAVKYPKNMTLQLKKMKSVECPKF